MSSFGAELNTYVIQSVNAMNCIDVEGEKRKYMERTSAEKGAPVLFLLKCLLTSYLFTAAMLLLLAFLLYKLKLPENVVSIVIIGIYVVATFAGGFLAGKRLQSRKFVWGLLVGILYFGILAVVSVWMHGEVSELGESVFTTFILCSAGGMLGGMVS